MYTCVFDDRPPDRNHAVLHTGRAAPRCHIHGRFRRTVQVVQHACRHRVREQRRPVPPAALHRCITSAASNGSSPMSGLLQEGVCSIEGTKCTVVTRRSPVISLRLRWIVAPSATPSPAAPLINGQKNSHTEHRKLNGVFCSTAPLLSNPIRLLHPQQYD